MNKGIIVVKCKSGNVFLMTLAAHANDESNAEDLYYKDQGCTVEYVESATFQKCNCDHCQILEHKFHEL